MVVVATDVSALGIDEITLLAGHGANIDHRVGRSATMLLAPGLAGGRLIISPVLNSGDDYADVRVYSDAARAGINLAKQAGAKKPLLLVASNSEQQYQHAMQVAALAVGQESWVALERREASGDVSDFEAIGYWHQTISAKR